MSETLPKKGTLIMPKNSVNNAAGVPFTLTISSPIGSNLQTGVELSGVKLRRSTVLKGQTVSVYEFTDKDSDRVFLPKITDKTEFNIPFSHGLLIDQSQKPDASLRGMKIAVTGNVSRTGRSVTEMVEVSASAIRMQVVAKAQRTVLEVPLSRLTTAPSLFSDITQVSTKKKLRVLSAKDHPTVAQATKMLEERPTEVNEFKLEGAYSRH